ncbi:F-box protein [Aspergillus lucknowensis]|uniref:F-box domain-containing protein n=1 Tax=Aspergillus lucknowensis TaxID=176173 RepID=A0ABR4M287_9EURO
MLADLPVEVLLQITEYLDAETLVHLYELCRRLFHVAALQLRRTCRVKAVNLGTFKRDHAIDVTPHLTNRRTLKFVEELVIYGRSGYIDSRYCPLHVGRQAAEDLGRALMPLFRGWHVSACVPLQILGPRGYLRRHQQKLESLAIFTRRCDWDGDGYIGSGRAPDPSRKLSISRFHHLRTLSWTSLTSVNHCAALAEFLALHRNTRSLEELILSASVLARTFPSLNVFPIQPRRILFPRLRDLSLTNIDVPDADAAAIADFAHALQMHRLHSLHLRTFYYASDLLSTIAGMARTDTDTDTDGGNGEIPLKSLDITLNEHSARDTESLRAFFALSMPRLEDVFLCVTDVDQDSLRPHLTAILAPTGRKIRRFVYHRSLAVAGDVEGAWEGIAPPVIVDSQTLALFGRENLECVGISAELGSLKYLLSNHPTALSWEILHICSLCIPPDAESEYHPHNHLLVSNFTSDLDGDGDVDLTTPPRSVLNASRYRYTPEVRRFLAFAQWAFGAGRVHLPRLRLLVLGGVELAPGYSPRWGEIRLGRASECGDRDSDSQGYSYREVGEGDVEATMFEDNWDFFRV